MSMDNKRIIKEAILNAKTLEEVEKLKQLLQAGQIPGAVKATANGKPANGDTEVEMDED